MMRSIPLKAGAEEKAAREQGRGQAVMSDKKSRMAGNRFKPP